MGNNKISEDQSLHPLEEWMTSLTFNDIPLAIVKLIHDVHELKQLVLSERQGSIPIEDHLYSIPEAARKLRLKSRSSVYKLIHTKQVSSIKISGKRFIKASDIHNFLNLHSKNLNASK